MDSSEIFNEFNVKLLTSLPMKDVIFIAHLNSKGLFHGNLKDEVREKNSAADAAEHFLHNTVEKDLKIGSNESFIKLLSAMTEFDSDAVKSLAEDIKYKLGIEGMFTVARDVEKGNAHRIKW